MWRSLLFVALLSAGAQCAIIATNSHKGYTPLQYQCNVQKQKVWVDVLFLVDSSNLMTRNGLNEVVEFIVSSTRDLPIGQGDKQTRVGFITYGDKATLTYDLNHWSSSQTLISNIKMTYLGSTGTNIAEAIQLANKVFNSKTHRANVPKVIVVVAAGFKKGSDNPVPAANAFKDTGGIIITLEYLQEAGIPVPILKQIASQGYSISNQDEDLTTDTLPVMLGRANCFCPENYVPYLYNRPEYGCFRAARLPAEWSSAERSCSMEHDGKLVKVENYDKAKFLMTILKRSDSWIGLKRDKRQFVWPDNTRLEKSSFVMWYKGQEPLLGDECISMFDESKLGSYYWKSHPCTKGLPYVCEIKPCSSEKYCTEPLTSRRQAHRMYMAPLKQGPPQKP